MAWTQFWLKFIKIVVPKSSIDEKVNIGLDNGIKQAQIYDLNQW